MGKDAKSAGPNRSDSVEANKHVSRPARHVGACGRAGKRETAPRDRTARGRYPKRPVLLFEQQASGVRDLGNHGSCQGFAGKKRKGNGKGSALIHGRAQRAQQMLPGHAQP